MAVSALDHIYLETAHWDETVAFWEKRGFALEHRWGSDGHRAGRLVAGTAVIVLAEVAEMPEATVFFRVPGNYAADELAATHWGTRVARIVDPDGRTFALEAES